MGPHTTSDDPTLLPLAQPTRRSGGPRTRWPPARTAAHRGTGGRRVRRTCRESGGRGGGGAARRASWPCPTPNRPTCSRTCTRSPTRCSQDEERRLPGVPGGIRRGLGWPRRHDSRRLMRHHVARQGAQRRAAPGHGARPQGRPDGGGHRKARWRVPRHRGTAAGLRRPPGHRHAARRVRRHRHRRRARHARVPPGLRDPVRRLRLPRLRPDRLPGGQAALPQRGPRRRAADHPRPLRRRHRRRRAPLRVARGLLRPHGGAARRDAEQRGGRLPHDPAGDRIATTRSSSSSPSGATGRRARSTTDERCTRCQVPLQRGRRRSARAPTSPSPPTARWWPPRSTRRGIAEEEGTSWRSSTCARSRRSTSSTIEASVRKTGRLVVAHEATVFCGLGAEIAARISERCFFSLEAPVRRVGGFATPYPPSRAEHHYLPDADRILHEVDRCLQP